MSNSIIEAQQTLNEEIEKEFWRIKNGEEVNGVHITGAHYFYLNYCSLEGKKIELWDIDKAWFDLLGSIKEDEELRIIKSRLGDRIEIIKKPSIVGRNRFRQGMNKD